MQIKLTGVGRTFGRQVVFTDVNFTFKQGETYAILGGNGSGKSTLLSIIYSALHPSSGEINWVLNGKEIPVTKVPFKCSFSGPYYELIEELTALEFLNFHKKFKPFLKGIKPADVLEKSLLTDAKNKEIRHFSSGMKQRFKLALCLLADVDLILLDEPTSNLDPATSQWYRTLVADYREKRTLLIGSNFNDAEVDFCDHQFNITSFK